MSEQSTRNNAKGQDEVLMPDLASLWKELYFKTEAAWAAAFKDFVSTDTFVNMMSSTLDQYLAFEKIKRQNYEKYFELNPMASKKDIARVAELIISLEEKVDNLEFELVDNLRSMLDSLYKMLEVQEKYRGEIQSLNQELKTANKKIDNLNKKLNTLNKAPRGAKKSSKEEGRDDIEKDI